ncbi:MAG: hypothetical protein AAYR31_00065 [Candidatus Vidania fulgoroideorum]
MIRKIINIKYKLKKISFFGKKETNKKLIKNIIKIIKIILNKKNYILKIIFVKEKTIKYYIKKFKIKNKCDNFITTFNLNYSNLIFKFINSEIYINKKIIKKNYKFINYKLIHNVIHTLNYEHKNKKEIIQFMFINNLIYYKNINKN